MLMNGSASTKQHTGPSVFIYQTDRTTHGSRSAGGGALQECRRVPVKRHESSMTLQYAKCAGH